MKINWSSKVEKCLISQVNQWIDDGIIEETDASIYLFGLKEGSWFLLNVLMTLFMGWVLGDMKNAFWFLIFFFPLRRFAGGFHAKTRERCFFVSVLIVIIALISMNLLNVLNIGWEICLIIISSLGLLKWGPLEHSKNPLSIARYKRYRQLLTVSVLSELVFVLLFIRLGWKKGVTCITMAVAICFGLCIWDKRQKLFNIV